MPFAIPNVRVENPEAKAHTRIGRFRSVSNIPYAFAIQSFVGELSATIGHDELIGPGKADEKLNVVVPAKIAVGASGRKYPSTDGTTGLGRLGRAGRMAGNFHYLHQVSIDSVGNIYTAEVDSGKRLQKFLRYGPSGCSGTGSDVIGGEAAEQR